MYVVLQRMVEIIEQAIMFHSTMALVPECMAFHRERRNTVKWNRIIQEFTKVFLMNLYLLNSVAPLLVKNYTLGHRSHC